MDGRLSFSGKERSGPGPHLAPLVGQRISDLVKSIDPNYVIDRDAEEQILQLADDFLDKVVHQATRLAQHRGSKVLDVQDLQIVLAKNFGITVPGLGLPNIRPIKPTRTVTSTAKASSGTKRKSSTAAGDGPSRKKSNTGSGSMSAAAASQSKS
jgi:transcription initiation factor TFIID subunit 12